MIELARTCDEIDDGHEAFLEYVERDHALLIALARKTVEEKRESEKKRKVDLLETNLESE